MQRLIATLLCPIAAATLGAATLPKGVDELRFCLHGTPKTFDPLQVADSSAETIRYLTAGVLVRLDRRTQQLSPELAASWRVAPGNREIAFTLRPGVRFSDGTPVAASDVVFTMKKLLDPALHSPVADGFRFASGTVAVEARGTNVVLARLPKPVAQPAALFDGVPILAERSPDAVAGPYMMASNKSGSEILLVRNPYYWKRDSRGNQLPTAGTLRIRIQTNRELELLDFERGDLDVIPELTPDIAERVAAKNPAALVDLGLTLDSLLLWFNQVPGAALPAYKKAWFQSSAFRKALSLAVNRDDICRIAFRGKAKPGVGPISPANRYWFNGALKADSHDPGEASRRLRAAGFELRNGALTDSQGHAVEFSVVTNAGNKTHERVLSLVQQDWKRVGVKLTVVTLDFPSLIERITRTFAYEACLLPLTNIGLDPADQMNVWLSSSANHQWNPGQSTPATAWEREIDEQMGKLATSLRPDDRKRAFDRVQAIVSEQVPFLYLAHPQAQAAVSPALKLAGAPMWPYILWGLEQAAVRR